MRTCAFCPATKLTREHVWSDWIGRLFPPSVYVISRKNKHGDTNFWKEDSAGLVAKVACKQCNNGWMSDLEKKHAKPTMQDMIRHGGAVSLLPLGIASLAAFAFKTTVVSNHMGILGRPFFSTSQRYRFAKTLEIPSGVQMWLATINPPPGRIRGVLRSVYGKCPPTVRPAFDLYVCTFSIGYMVFQVLAVNWENKFIRSGLPFPGFRQGREFDNLAVPFWPSNGNPVLWPPLEHLSYDTIEAFCNRWKDINIPGWMVSAAL